ncbi:MAG TPA: hypothetical protein VH370_23980 [Humisphaera sp.]|jgi:hypothetical protein|nr:hypothetical protein [Humisphaera sp.]
MGAFRNFRKSSSSKVEYFDGRHRYEHWYCDNQVYFITARCRERYPAFASEEAKSVFWDRFTHYTTKYHFTPFVTSLLDNHYHTIGYLRTGAELGPMMQKIHGSVAKLVNDLLPERRASFWVDAGHQDYFDGCIRNELQCRRAFRYTLTQCKRHRICADPKNYAHTRVGVDIDRAVRRALQLQAFMEKIPYKRYE